MQALVLARMWRQTPQRSHGTPCSTAMAWQGEETHGTRCSMLRGCLLPAACMGVCVGHKAHAAVVWRVCVRACVRVCGVPRKHNTPLVCTGACCLTRG
jgi:hypothetical protein